MDERVSLFPEAEHQVCGNIFLICCSPSSKQNQLLSGYSGEYHWRTEDVFHAVPQAKQLRRPLPHEPQDAATKFQDTTKPKKSHIACILTEDSAREHGILRSEMIVALARMMRIKENHDHYIFPVSKLISGLVLIFRQL